MVSVSTPPFQLLALHCRNEYNAPVVEWNRPNYAALAGIVALLVGLSVTMALVHKRVRGGQ